MKKSTIVLYYLEMFLFSIVLIGLTTTTVLKLTILNENFVKSMFTEEHYEDVETSLKEEMKRSMISSGLDNEIIDDMFTKNDIKNTTNQVLDIIYHNEKNKINTSSVENKLRENIKKNLEKKDFTLEDENGYNEFVKSTMDIYRGEFIMLNQLPKVGKIEKAIDKIITVAALILGVIVITWVLLRKSALTKILPAGLFTTSFLTLFATYYINKEAGLSSITIISITFSKILRKIIMSTFNVYKITAITYLIVGIIILLVKKYHRHRHHHHKHRN